MRYKQESQLLLVVVVYLLIKTYITYRNEQTCTKNLQTENLDSLESWWCMLHVPTLSSYIGHIHFCAGTIN